MSKILDFGKENVLEFIQTTIKKCNNVKEDILDEIKIPYVLGTVIEGDIIEHHSSQGFYYERLWDLCIKFGATNLTLPAIKGRLQTSHIINENPNKIGIEFQSNCWDGNKLNKNPGGYLLQPVRSGNSGGYSDITFLNKRYDDTGVEIGEELYFISVKYFKEEKEIGEYDIGKICTLIREHEKKNRIIKLYIFVKDKKSAIAKFNAQHSSSNILIKYINPGGNYEHIYDIMDLQNSFFKLKKILEQYNYLQTQSNINDFQSNYLNVLKDVFIPRFHQELFILKINKLIENGEKNVLVGAIPRSGKSYIMAGTILEYVKKQEQLHPGKKVKFLLITPAPNETFGEYESIFNKYIEFDKLGIDVVTYKDGINSKTVCKNKDKHCVIIVSKQKLGWTYGNNAEKILAKEDNKVDNDAVETELEDETGDEDEDENDGDKEITRIKQRIIKLFDTNPEIDVMFLDEAHFGMSTEKAKQIVDVLDSAISNTIKIYVTATYNKPLQTYGVKSDCKITWDMNDIQIMQNIDKKNIVDNSIQKQFGNDIYVKALEYFGDKTGLTLIDKFKKEYAVYPKPYMITSIWDKDFLNIEKLKIGDTEFGWDMNKLFSTTGDSDTFANEEQIKELMHYYFGYPDKNENYDKQTFYRARGILPRIRNICLNKCRTLQPQHKTTQLWFLPLGNGKIKNKTKALINLLTNSNNFNDVMRNYHFFVAVDIEDNTKKGRTIDGVTYMGNPHKIKTDIEEVEKKIKDGEIKKDNLIILAGQRLQLGISLRNVDIVSLWNSITSADAIFQILFRSMTEVEVPPCTPNEYCNEKKFGFMVDMNPQRALTNVSLFTANVSKKKDANEIQKYRQITDLINIDEDVLRDKYGDDEKSRNDFVKELFNKLYASWNINVENIKKVIGKFTFDMTKLDTLKKSFEQINVDKHKKQSDEITGKEDDEVFETGKKKEKTGETKKKSKKDNAEKEKEINLIETATELISEFISLLNVFTLYADKGAQCILTDSSKSNAQITIMDDIDVLKGSVYENKDTKDIFLKILNGRLTGNSEDPYPEKVIEDVLDAMDNFDDKQVMNKIIMSQKKQYYTINEPDKLLEFINGELKPKEKEKKENGEVFTHLSLVNEMLDKLDEAYIKEYGKSIFTEMGFKWLDPAVGIGNFPIIVYLRLMKGLATQIPNEEERRKHILEQMIYSAELTPKNVFIYKKIFCGDKYKLNIYQGDTLKMDVKKEFKLPADFVGFDVVMGNPPFQGHDNKKKIYINFVINVLDNMLNENAYFLFITPKQIIRILLGENIQQQQLDKMYNILYINTRNTLKTDYFKQIGSDFMYFIIQNNEYQGTTTFVNDDNIVNNIHLKFNSFLPLNTNVSINIANKLLINDSRKSLWRKASRIDAMSETDQKKNDIVDKADVIHKNKLVIFLKTNPKDDVYKWTSKEHPDMFKYKVLYPSLGERYVIDEDANLFTGNTSVLYILCDSLNECKNVVKLGTSKLFKYLKRAYTGKNPVDSVWNNLIKPSNFDIEINNDNDIYKYFNLTKNEIEEIENNQEVEPKKTQSPIKLDKPIESIHTPEKNEGIQTSIPLTIPIPRKKRTLKKLPKIISDESSNGNNSVSEKPLDKNAGKIFNPLTNRHVKNTTANRKKIGLQTLKLGGKLKKRTRRNKCNKY
jgi:hypothetical protein